MALFIGSLIAVALCGLALGLRLLTGGGPVEGGCGRAGGAAARCAGCPRRQRAERCEQTRHGRGRLA